jgi:disulfide bond formation protein DsbB
VTPLVQNVSDFLSAATVAADILGIFLLIIVLSPLKKSGWGKDVADFFGDYAIELAFLIALAATCGSLFYSNVAQFQPCLLCLWDRIFLFPQPFILLFALFLKDQGVRKYAILLSVIGTVVAAYHTYLQFGGTDVINCAANGVGCEHVYFLEYGYVTIPTMALTAFVLIVIFLSFKTPKEG